MSEGHPGPPGRNLKRIWGLAVRAPGCAQREQKEEEKERPRQVCGDCSLVGTVSPEGEHLSPSCCVTRARARHLASLTRHTPLYLPLPHLRHPFFFFFLALLSLCLLLSISVAGFQVEAKKICTQRGQRLTSRCACRSDGSGCRQAVSQDSNPWGGTSHRLW